MTIDSLTFDSLGRRYRSKADRRRCDRQDNPLPRPSDDELMAMYTGQGGSTPLTAPQIAAQYGYKETTVRSWITRAQWRHLADPRRTAAFQLGRLRRELSEASR